jgi:hypothetical protein
MSLKLHTNMKVNVKVLNGDVIVIEMETYSETAVRDALKDESSDYAHLVEFEKDENEEDKNMMAFFTPIVPVKELLTFLDQAIKWESYGGDFLLKLFRQCVQAAKEDGRDEPIVEYYYPDSRKYYNQIVLYNDHYRGDSVITCKGTTLFEEITRRIVMKGKTNVTLKRKEMVDFYEKICETTNKNILEKEMRTLIELCVNGDSYRSMVVKLIDLISHHIPDVFNEIFENIQPMEERIYYNALYNKQEKVDRMSALLLFIIKSR